MRATKPFLVLLGERLRQLREARQISVNDAAQHLGRHRTFIWKIERGVFPPPADIFPKLAALYQVEEVDLTTFPALATRHEIIDLTRDLPEELLQTLLKECRRLAKTAKTMAVQSSADPDLPWQHVRSSGATPEKHLKHKAG